MTQLLLENGRGQKENAKGVQCSW